MEKQTISRVSIDTAINEKIPSVVIASINYPNQTEVPKQNFFSLMIKRFVNFILDFLETIVVALSIFVVIYLFLMQPHEIKGNSMEPNFKDKEYILTDKISYRLHTPVRGDVVIFKAPVNPDVDYIKRVIGVAGDRVKVQNGAVFANGEKLKEDYLKDPTFLFPGSFMTDGVEITVPEGKIFVLGDNRAHSSDSRQFGPIVINSVVGRAFLRYWPINSLGVLPVVHY